MNKPKELLTALSSKLPLAMWAILFFAAVLIFYRISHVDMVGDNALYATRSIGLTDYLFSDDQFQPTPLVWYTHTPWWVTLSWHDHPLVLFIIQNIFFKLGQSVFFAKLPYALLALGTIVLTYFSTRRLAGDKAGWLAALFLTLNASFIWFARSAYMESGVLFFLALAWWAFINFLSNPARWWWGFGISLGLLTQVKFTTFFFPAAVLAYLIICRRDLLKTMHFWGALAVAFLVAVPQILYNLLMYLDTGHFSLQFARLFGQTSPWTLAGLNRNPFANLAAAFTDLGLTISWPYLLLAGLALIIVIRTSEHKWLLSIPVFFIILEDAVFGSKNLYSIYLAPLMAVAFIFLENHFKNKSSAKFFRITIYVAGLYLLLYSILSAWPQVLPSFKAPGWWRGLNLAKQNYGVFQLDQYIDSSILKDKTLTYFELFGKIKDHSRHTQRYLYPLSEEEFKKRLEHATVVIFDPNINWYARVWLFDRRRFYDNAPFFSTRETTVLDNIHLDNFYFIKASSAAPLDPTVFQDNLSNVIEQNMQARKIEPDLIYRDDGQVAFKVYHILNFGQ